MLGLAETIRRQLHTSAAGVADAWPRGQTSVSEDGEIADETATDGSDTDSPPHLYNCPSCDRIYVATDKHTCSTCDTAVDRVE